MSPQRFSQLSNDKFKFGRVGANAIFSHATEFKTGIRGSNSSPTNCFCQYRFGLTQNKSEIPSQAVLILHGVALTPGIADPSDFECSNNSLVSFWEKRRITRYFPNLPCSARFHHTRARIQTDLHKDYP